MPALWKVAILRLGLVSGAALCWYSASRLWEAGNMVIERAALVLALINFFLAAVMLIATILHDMPRWSRWLIPLAVVLMWGSLYHVNTVNREQSAQVYTTDVHLFSDYAATLTRMGENPYQYDMLDSYRVYRASKLYSTPLLNGDTVGGVSYPSLAFLLFVPFQTLGIDTALIYPLALLACLLLVYAVAPEPLRPLVIVPFLVNPNYTLYSLGLVNDIVWATMLCLMVVCWRRTALAALIFGLACAYKQQPWFLAPFLVVRLWHETIGQSRAERLKLLAQFILISAAVFTVLNVPYWVADFGAWLNGVLRPLTQNMIILGQGYSSLTLFGVIFLPQWVFSYFTYGILIVLLTLYARYFAHWRELLWIAPVIALWFSHRSLSSYWYFYLLPLVTAMMVALRREMSSPQAQEVSTPRGARGLILVPFAIGGAALVVAGIFALSPNALKLEIIGRVLYNSTDSRLTVQVSNNSETPVTPRFSVQSWGEQPAFWQVLHGAEQIAPNGTESYVLYTDAPSEVFNPAVGAQVIVNDANRFGVRASSFLPPAQLAYVDALPNSRWTYWLPNGSAPIGWGFIGVQPNAQVSLLTSQESGYDGNALHFTVMPSGTAVTSASLDTWVMLPEAPITLWVKPPQDANIDPLTSPLYGLEMVLTSSGARALILFGAGAARGTLTDGTPYLTLPAAPQVWSQLTIHLPSVLKELAVPLPALQLRAVGTLQIPMIMMNFRLFISADRPFSADFGTLSNSSAVHVSADDQIAAAVASPLDVLLWRANINAEMRNHAIAAQYYTLALAVDPTSAQAHYGLGAENVALGRYDEATTPLAQAAALGYSARTRVLLAQGWMHFGSGSYADAQLAFTAALDQFTQDNIVYGASVEADLYYGLGASLIAQDRGLIAEAMVMRALDLDPQHRQAYLALQQFYIAEGRCVFETNLRERARTFNVDLPSLICEGST